MCFECYKAILSKSLNGESEIVPQPKFRRQATTRRGGLQDAKQRDPARSVGFREDRSPRQHDSGAVQGLF